MAGNGRYGFSGDGGPATSAQLSFYQILNGLTVDTVGNLYIGDSQRTIAFRWADPTKTAMVLAARGASSMAARNHDMAAAAAMGGKRQCAEPALQVRCAQWVAAAPGRFLRCGSSEMSRIDYDAAPRIRPGGARNATHATCTTGC